MILWHSASIAILDAYLWPWLIEHCSLQLAAVARLTRQVTTLPAVILVRRRLSQPRAFPKEAIPEVIGRVATRFAILSAVLLESRKPTLSTSEPIRPKVNRLLSEAPSVAIGYPFA